jgi:hypothetical protein
MASLRPPTTSCGTIEGWPWRQDIPSGAQIVADSDIDLQLIASEGDQSYNDHYNTLGDAEMSQNDRTTFQLARTVRQLLTKVHDSACSRQSIIEMLTEVLNVDASRTDILETPSD